MGRNAPLFHKNNRYRAYSTQPCRWVLFVLRPFDLYRKPAAFIAFFYCGSGRSSYII